MEQMMPGLLSPEGSESKAVTAKTADDVNDLFKTLDAEDYVDDKGKEKVPSKEKETVKDKEEPEEKDAEGDIELVDDEDEDIEKLDLSKDDDIEIVAPPRKAEIVKEFPELFKKFPFLEKMMYRDKQYTELFGSFDDAKELAERSEVFESFDKQLMSGKTEEILKNVKETDPKAFDKIVDNYLQTLGRVDKEAYYEVVGDISKKLITELVKEANKPNNPNAEELKQAALIINQFLFGSSEFVPHKPRVAESSDNAERSEAEQERLQYVQERFESSRDDLQGAVDNTLKATISEYIDPRNTMTPYVKKNAVADAMAELARSINGDTGFRKNIDRLWKNAFDAKFSKESLGKIKSYYLGRAKQSLPSAIKKARTEALKDSTPSRTEKDEIDDKDEKETTPQRRGTMSPGRPSQPKKNEMKKGESVAEFFARD